MKKCRRQLDTRMGRSVGKHAPISFLTLRWGPTPSACQRSPWLAPMDRHAFPPSDANCDRRTAHRDSIASWMLAPLDVRTVHSRLV